MGMVLWRVVLWVLVLGLVVTGCTVAPKTAQSGLPRETAPELPATDLEALVMGNTAFALDLYRQLGAGEGNVFFSPHSISVALGMTYAGARGETAAQMAETLHFTLAGADLHRAFNALELRLAAAAEGEAEAAFVLHNVNSLWAEQEYTFLPDFLDVLAQHYGAGLRLVSFKTAAEAARQAINAWVEEQTAERIRDLIPEGGVDDLTRLVLVNAIYFKAGWQAMFDAALTADGAFTPLSGAAVTVPMMRWSQPEWVRYAQGEGYQAVALPYKGGKASMVLVVPDAGRFAAFEAGLSAEALQGIMAGLEGRSVALTMPKFEVEAEFSLAETLAAMGMPAAFDPAQADLSGMDGTRDLYIGAVFHKAFLAVDEEGTEAAAATAVVVQVESAPMVDVELTVDRPFMLFIRDTESGELLFVGRVVNPS